MLSQLLLLLLCSTSALAFCPKLFNNSTACSCEETVEGPVVKCSGPASLPVIEKLKTSHMEFRELALENANIIEIGPRAFKNLRIKKLVLDKNRIKEIHRDAFRGLENVMQELSIAENALLEVPTKALTGMKALNVLNLKCNKIDNITQQAFPNMTSLLDVNLACNNICQLASDTFKTVHRTLQNLILDNNCLTEFPAGAVRNMDNLIALHIKYNKINVLAQNDLTNLTSLSILSLTGNNITEIRGGALVNTPNLRYLYINENYIKTIDNGVMAQFKQAQVIDLSFNNITEIKKDMFDGLESIQHLNFDSNAIKSVEAGAFAGTPLLLLWLPNNCLTEVNQQTFQGALFLRQVSLANNNIKNIKQLSFAHLANLHTLDLANNKIMTLQAGALTGADHLTVRLQENPMVCTQDGFHVMNGNEAINLTTEVNKICKKNWQAETVDLCPKAQPRPMPAPCCNRIPLTTTTTTTTTEEPMTTTVEKVEKEEKEDEAQVGEEEEEEEAEEEEQNNEEEVAENDGEQTNEEEEVVEEEEEEDEKTTAATTTTTQQTKRAQKINMDRFWKLSHKPSANSPFMRHLQGNKKPPKFLRTTTTEAPEEEEEQEEEEEEAQPEEEEEEESEYVEENTKEEEEAATTTTATTTSTVAPRKIPARIRERQRMLANTIPWMSQRSKIASREEKQVEEEFSKDDKIETLNNDQTPQ